jgi:hypothetical protein
MYTYINRLCGLVVRVPGYRSRSLGFDSRHQILWEVVGLERSPLSLIPFIKTERKCPSISSSVVPPIHPLDIRFSGTFKILQIFFTQTNQLNGAFLEKPAVVQLLVNFPSFYGTRRFTAAFTRASTKSEPSVTIYSLRWGVAAFTRASTKSEPFVTIYSLRWGVAVPRPNRQAGGPIPCRLSATA